MSSRILPILSILCMIVCIALITFWMRSYQQIDSYVWNNPGNRYSIGSVFGRIAWTRMEMPQGPAGAPMKEPGRTGISGFGTVALAAEDWSSYIKSYGSKLDDNFLGFAWTGSDPEDVGIPHKVQLVSVPHWFLICLFLALPLFLVVQHARRQAAAPQKKS